MVLGWFAISIKKNKITFSKKATNDEVKTENSNGPKFIPIRVSK